jgi:hypothetical protein
LFYNTPDYANSAQREKSKRKDECYHYSGVRHLSQVSLDNPFNAVHCVYQEAEAGKPHRNDPNNAKHYHRGDKGFPLAETLCGVAT